MKKLAQGFNTAAQDSNLGSRSRESEVLPLSHCALYCIVFISNPTGSEDNKTTKIIHTYQLRNEYQIYESSSIINIRFKIVGLKVPFTI